MGFGNSRQKKEPMEFYGEPQVDKFNFQVTEGVLRMLESKPAAASPIVSHPATRESKKYKELAEGHSTSVAVRHADQVLDRHQPPSTLNVPADVSQAQADVVSCYQKYPTTALNCHTQVQQYQDAVSRAHRELF